MNIQITINDKTTWCCTCLCTALLVDVKCQIILSDNYSKIGCVYIVIDLHSYFTQKKQCAVEAITSSRFLIHFCTIIYILILFWLYNTLIMVKRLATGWTVRGSNPGGGEIFRTSPDWPWGPPSLLYNGYRVFPGVKSDRGVTLTPHPLLVPCSRKSRAIPLLHLRAVRQIQSLNAWTKMHFFWWW